MDNLTDQVFVIVEGDSLEQIAARVNGFYKQNLNFRLAGPLQFLEGKYVQTFIRNSHSASLINSSRT